LSKTAHRTCWWQPAWHPYPRWLCWSIAAGLKTPPNLFIGTKNRFNHPQQQRSSCQPQGRQKDRQFPILGSMAFLLHKGINPASRRALHETIRSYPSQCERRLCTQCKLQFFSSVSSFLLTCLYWHVLNVYVITATWLL
jgi:hypothetical protein